MGMSVWYIETHKSWTAEYETHPEQQREWPDEAAATLDHVKTVPIPLGSYL
jgi:hypothetical protein